MKNIIRIFVVFVLLLQVQLLVAQVIDLKSLYENRSEMYFRLQFSSIKELAQIDKLVYVDKIENQYCIAYANKKQFANLVAAGFQPELLLPPSLQNTDIEMFDGELTRNSYEWDAYPTYAGYVALMNGFQTNYPSLCTIHSIATLQSGHQLLVAQINSGTAAGKSQFLYTSSIHGDETTGYVLTLRLIDYLLSNYGVVDEITNLVDNLDIWICPLANPDGTYYLNDNTVNGATRGNANGIDLNRNYRDPEDGLHPDGNLYQAETNAFMSFAEENNFVMAANYHGGAEVINYPWDTWSRRHADDNWWQFVSHEYADTAQFYGPNGYFGDFNDGISNGYDWYSISGGRQDYMNYFRHCREVTIEVSNVKTIPASQLQAYWNYNYRSMLNYLGQAMYGFTGTVTDSITGTPLHAKVEILGHDLDSSLVYSALPNGDYHRPIKNGTYSLTFSATGYYSKTVSNLQISNYQIVTNNVQLVPTTLAAAFEASATDINKDASVNFFDHSFGQNITSWNWIFEGAVPNTSNAQNPTNINYPEVGDFNVQLTITNADGQTDVILIDNYIHVNLNFLMTNGSITTCEGIFYDTGGSSSNYGDNQNIIMTLIPDSADHLMTLDFVEFDVEPDNNCAYDWLKIYDGSNTSAPVMGTWCGSNSPGLVTATNNLGTLTVSFHSDQGVTGSGWKALISCIPMVSVFENTEDQIVVFPNPVTGHEVNITSNEPIEQVIVNDVQGNTIVQENVAKTTRYLLQTGKMKSGVYILNIITSKNILVKRLIVL